MAIYSWYHNEPPLGDYLYMNLILRCYFSSIIDIVNKNCRIQWLYGVNNHIKIPKTIRLEIGLSWEYKKYYNYELVKLSIIDVLNISSVYAKSSIP